MKHAVHEYTTNDKLKDWIHSYTLTNSILIQIFSGVLDTKIVQNVLNILRKEIPEAIVIGASTSGEILDGTMKEETIIISISMSIFDKTILKSMHAIGKDSKEMGHDVVSAIIEDDTKSIIMFADGLKCNGDEILYGLEDVVSDDIVVSGGMSGDNGNFEKTFCIHGDKIFEAGIVAVSLSNPTLEVFRTYNLSWRPIGKRMKITKSKGNIIYELDNKPIKEIYSKYLGSQVVAHMPASTIEFPLIINENNIDIARSMIALTDDNGIMYAGAIPKGKEVRFGIGSPSMLAQSANKTYSIASQQSIEGLYIYSCSARKMFIGRELESEFTPLATIAPLVGFFTYGEFYHGYKSNKLLNITTTTLGLAEYSDIKNHHCKEHKELNDDSLTINALMNLVEMTNKENEEYAQELQKQKELYALVFKNTLSGVMIIDIETNKFIDCNENAIKILKCDSKESVLNLHLSQVSPEYQADGRLSSEKFDEMNAIAVKNGSHTFEWVHLTKISEEIWIEVVLTPIVLDDKKVLHVVWKDIAKRKESEAEIIKQKNLLDYQAHHDGLTGLPNRTLFYHRLQQAIKKGKGQQGIFTVLFIDLDGFKTVNDTHGHDIGNKTLQEVSRRFKNAIRREDTLARLGGDEFSILTESLIKKEDAVLLAKKVLMSLDRVLLIEQLELKLSCSIGLSCYPDDGIEMDELLINADKAMYTAKDNGKNNVEVYKKIINK
ncbi:diguanylate cyclase [Sulfurimonas sp. SAG-AH-194-I05]|nr:diguanylate cyclase [Sulfurimonas sp. SAG-AH-194-I05]MDF1874821.1 diguanylate cyclase [Sulfurimonas sp. SAG-AH-194-I05]